MSACLHHNLLLLSATGKKARCRHCHLTIDPEELSDNHCPECYEVYGLRRYDFEIIDEGTAGSALQREIDGPLSDRLTQLGAGA